jgi:hypothetical protein
MFNLDTAIAEWRQQMLDAGIKASVTLEELESHLREEVEQQVRSDMDAEWAFEIAMLRIGRPNVLKDEFKKNESGIMKRLAIILLGVFGILIGPAILLPALALHRVQGIWSGETIVPTALGMIIVLAGMAITIYGSKKPCLKFS